MCRRAFFAFACALLALCTAHSAARAQDATPTLVVKGHILAVEGGYLVFTTGDAVKLGAVQIPPWATLGAAVRVRIDAAAKTVTAIEHDPGKDEPGEIDASQLPRDVVAVDPRSARASAGSDVSGAQGAAGTVTVRIDVNVPDVTPPGDDVYLSTDRSNFASAELRMNRVDAFDWTISLPLASGSTLRYEFTRGSPATVERTRNGSIVTPRELTAGAQTHVTDRVERWADRF